MPSTRIVTGEWALRMPAYGFRGRPLFAIILATPGVIWGMSVYNCKLVQGGATMQRICAFSFAIIAIFALSITSARAVPGYEIKWNSFIMSPTTDGAIAYCSPGKTVLGGGFWIHGAHPNALTVVTKSAPAAGRDGWPSGIGWEVQAIGRPVSVYVYAICASSDAPAAVPLLPGVSPATAPPGKR